MRAPLPTALATVLRFFGSFFLLAGFLQAAVPPRPAPGQFLHDLAGVVSTADAAKIRELQQNVFQQAQVPLVVVTVSSMGGYDPGAASIESLARLWFNSWGLGSQGKNDGILVLISTGDRKGRIELGAAWGRRWDDYAQSVMSGEMIPHFKSGDYSGGLVAGVEALARMALAGAASTPPSPTVYEKFKATAVGQFVAQKNPIEEELGPKVLGVMVLLGSVCVAAGLLLPQHRKPLLIAGLSLIGLAVFFWVVAVVAGLFFGGSHLRRRSSWLGSDYGDSGGFGGGFDGGSSGGGGASGSW
ncbi:MAG: TPM domain-containing protein [Pseudomonadota bacterium]